MSASSFGEALARLLAHEGGYVNHPSVLHALWNGHDAGINPLTNLSGVLMT